MLQYLFSAIKKPTAANKQDKALSQPINTKLTKNKIFLMTKNQYTAATGAFISLIIWSAY